MTILCIYIKKNSTADFSSIVDDNRIFHFVEYIKSSSTDNWVFTFNNINDIKDIIKSQLSYYLLLFSQKLVKDISKEKTIDTSKLTFAKFPSNIDEIQSKEFSQEEETSFRNGIKELHNNLINILTSDGNNDNKLEKLKTLWVIAKYGELNWEANGLEIDNDVFKDYAWSTSKGKRVSNQLKPLGINYDYDFDEEQGKCTVSLDFKNETEDCQVTYALKTIVADLLNRYDNEEAFELFKKADFRIYMT